MASIAANAPSDFVFGVSRSLTGRPWRWRGGAPGDAADAQRLGIDDVTARLFTARGARLEDIAQLVAPTIRDLLPDPSIFRDMDRAATRIADAVTTGEAIVVFGDYDVRPGCRRGAGRPRASASWCCRRG